MLYGMSALMGGNADGCHRSGIVHRIRKTDDVAGGVIVIGQFA